MGLNVIRVPYKFAMCTIDWPPIHLNFNGVIREQIDFVFPFLLKLQKIPL